MNYLVDKFLEFVSIDTQADGGSTTYPSTFKQFDLARILEQELKDLGLVDVSMSEYGVVTGTLPKNTDKNIPTIGFVAHMDTAPGFSGKDVKPRIIKNYDGEAITLNSDLNVVMNLVDFPELKNYKGQDLIVTDGTTLLGADDKAGIAEILTGLKYLIANPEIIHGDIRVGFTPDEEIGRGVVHFDIEKFGADFAYTLDGGEIGELEYENFNAASANLTIKGTDIHPGTSKNKMVNSSLIAMELHSMLPVHERPEYTEKYEGFFLLVKFNGTVENTEVNYIIRDHSMEKFNEKKELIQEAVSFLQKKYKTAEFNLEVKDTYFNMKEYILPSMFVVDLAKKSMMDIGVTPIIKPIRGGTDGAKLSVKGLPCPNIFTGGHNFHGKFEYIPIQSMEKAVETMVQIVKNSIELAK